MKRQILVITMILINPIVAMRTKQHKWLARYEELIKKEEQKRPHNTTSLYVKLHALNTLPATKSDFQDTEKLPKTYNLIDNKIINIDLTH